MILGSEKHRHKRKRSGEPGKNRVPVSQKDKNVPGPQVGGQLRFAKIFAAKGGRQGGGLGKVGPNPRNAHRTLARCLTGIWNLKGGKR